MSDENPNGALKKLDSRLKEARREPIDPTRRTTSKVSGSGGALGLAFRVGVELVSAVGVGALIGWLLDEWLETRPWLMLVFIFMGGAAGILNVYRMARGFGYAVGYQQKDERADSDEGADQGK